MYLSLVRTINTFRVVNGVGTSDKILQSYLMTFGRKFGIRSLGSTPWGAFRHCLARITLARTKRRIESVVTRRGIKARRSSLVNVRYNSTVVGRVNSSLRGNKDLAKSNRPLGRRRVTFNVAGGVVLFFLSHHRSVLRMLIILVTWDFLRRLVTSNFVDVGRISSLAVFGNGLPLFGRHH